MLKHLTFFLVLACFSCFPGVYAVDGVLVATNDVAFGDKWSFTEGGVAPEISQVDEVFYGQPFSVLMFLTDYHIDFRNTAKVTFDIEIIGPDGEIFLTHKDLEAVNREMTSSKQVLLGVDYFSVNFSKDALEGLYIIRAEVLDWKNQTRTTLSQALLLSNFVYEPFFEEKETFFAWRNQYYRNPRPELALDAFMFHAQNGTVANQSEFWAHFAFFLEIFRQNDFLIPELIQRYAELSLQGKIHSIYLLRYLEHPLIRPFLASLDGPEGETYAHLLENNFLKPNYPVETQDQLAMAWAAFLATGRFEPIENIVQSLNFVTYKGAIAQYRAAPDLQAQKRESARYEALYQATFQTLVANCREHPLIEAYCRYMLLKEDLNPEVHDELIEVFKRI